MDINTIKKEIALVNDKLFEKVFNTIDDSFEFIETNNLRIIKANYFFLLEYLNTTMAQFTNLDHEFYSPTLKKLQRDINNLHTELKSMEESLHAIEELFITRVLNKITLFKGMKKELVEIKKNDVLSPYDKADIQTILEHYTRMKEIYLKTFKDDYISQATALIHELKTILNIKIYYFDKMLWIEANHSLAIARVLKVIEYSKNITSKVYIKHKLDVLLPYTDNYKYLQKCLRIYK
ncbi:hypothetical protein JHD48_06345 [Sulfurimonas sp. SAG-AH-194-I05]|nr:hypothetical protein [Sulfurimonas sp. SAG-AH-194-I05]MDF1875348.1 hypothetical protein [Sulfurimonas sp. SAG-AH-194-I05]